MKIAPIGREGGRRSEQCCTGSKGIGLGWEAGGQGGRGTLEAKGHFPKRHSLGEKATRNSDKGVAMDDREMVGRGRDGWRWRWLTKKLRRKAKVHRHMGI